MEIGDTNREIVKDYSKHYLLVHVVNEGGCPYSVIEEKGTKFELASCVREKEEDMCKCFPPEELDKSWSRYMLAHKIAEIHDMLNFGNYISVDEAISYAQQGAESIRSGYDTYDVYTSQDLQGQTMGELISDNFELILRALEEKRKDE